MTGEMHESEVTAENFPVHFAVAKEFDGTVHPFDQYQGPFVMIPGRHAGTRFFLSTDDGVYACWWDEDRNKFSSAFTATDDPQDLVFAVASFRELFEFGGTDEPQWRNHAATRPLLESLSSYVAPDDAGLPREQFLRLVADRIDDDLPERPQATPERTRPVYVLVWQDNIDLTVETHATEAAALDSARTLRSKQRGRKFHDVADLNRYMNRHGIAGGIYPRSIPV